MSKVSFDYIRDMPTLRIVATDIDVADEIISFLEDKVENTDKSKPIDI